MASGGSYVDALGMAPSRLQSSSSLPRSSPANPTVTPFEAFKVQHSSEKGQGTGNVVKRGREGRR
jgi:hypothetical protein